MVYVYVIRANVDGIGTQDGSYSNFRKKRTSETALAVDGDMEELGLHLKGTASSSKPIIGCSGTANVCLLSEEIAGIEGWVDKSDPQSHLLLTSLTLTLCLLHSGPFPERTTEK